MRAAPRVRALKPRVLALLSSGALATALLPSALRAPAAEKADPARAEGLAAFDTVAKVLQHPRCRNCHIPGDAPLQFDAGLPHTQNVVRGPGGYGAPGLPCTTCHGAANPPASYGPHTPPGAPGWELPPPGLEMVFIGLSNGELCERLKDKSRNGGRDLAALAHHIDDKIVRWGWDPGVGRAPVPVPYEEFVAKFKTWAAAGGPCPAVVKGKTASLAP
ncbi:MAG: hypothetical protein ACHQM4_05020 [Thermoanaerobaculia bacterium]